MDFTTADPISDRLFRHMAWANAYLFDHLAMAPKEALSLSISGSEWTVGAITEHFVRSAAHYAHGVGGELTEWNLTTPRDATDLMEFKAVCARNDAQLRELALQPDGLVNRQREGRTVTRARSTILAQSIHHSIEHRAQIADILVAHGIHVVDLDEMDVWALGDAEGLGH